MAMSSIPEIDVETPRRPSRPSAEPDEESTTGVVSIANRTAAGLAKDRDDEVEKARRKFQALSDKLRNSGPIATRRKR